MTDPIHVRRYTAPPCKMKEILRYAGCPRADAATLDLAWNCLEEAKPGLRYAVCWREFPITRVGDVMDLGFVQSTSSTLARHLTGCESLVLFAATVGLVLDRLISRYSRLSPSRALLFQAIGAERIESLCDVFQADLAQEYQSQGLYPQLRFSPGYGDLPLTLQRDVFQVLDCPRQIGLSLNESLLMSPSKSVTGLIGLSRSPAPCNGHNKCGSCRKDNCSFRCD